jgi:hypothetical protein
MMWGEVLKARRMLGSADDSVAAGFCQLEKSSHLRERGVLRSCVVLQATHRHEVASVISAQTPYFPPY